MSANGIIILDKPEGMTSRGVDNALQRLFKTRKVGHLGTLDPFATGLLIVAVNDGTKYLPYLPDEEKTYEAKLILGVKTDTGDKSGATVEERPVPKLTKAKIMDAFSSFLGAGEQIPPMTSAIKVDGKALYRLAHKGIEVDRKPRSIYIHSLDLVEFNDVEITFRASVSKGTYIRTLGEDIAKKLRTVGYLQSLRRLSVGPIDLKKAITMESVSESALVDPADILPMKNIEVDDELAKKVSNGVKLNLKFEEPRLLIRYRGKPLAIYEKEGEGYRCARGISTWR